MERWATLKVGIAVLLGIAGLLMTWSFLAHRDWNSYTLMVRFPDTRGLQLQAPVRLSGVRIGEVSGIELRLPSREPVVTLRIQNRYRGAIPDDSRVVITTGLLVTTPQVEIIPGVSRTAMVPGRVYEGSEPQSPLAQLSPEADIIVRRFTNLLDTMSPSLERSMAHVEGILKRTETVMTDAAAVSARVRQIAYDPELERSLRATLRNLERLTAEARSALVAVSAELQGLLKDNSGRVEGLMTGLLDLLQRLTDTVDAARGLVTRLAEQAGDPRMQQSLQETLDLARATLARFNQVAADMHALLGDPETQGDVRATLSAVRDTAESGRKVADDVARLVDRLNLPSGGPKLGIGAPALTVEAGGRSERPYFRSNLGLRFPIGGDAGLHLGIYDLTETNSLIAQYETQLSRSGRFRYGLYAGKLGAGLDLTAPAGVDLRLDAFNPNRPQIDARAFFRLDEDFSFWVGAEGLLRHATPSLGIRLQR